MAEPSKTPIVAVWVPSTPSEQQLQRCNLRHPEEAPGWQPLTDGQHMGLVTLAKPADRACPCDVLIQCRSQVDLLLRSLDSKAGERLQRWPVHDRRKDLFYRSLQPGILMGPLRSADKLFWLQTAGQLPLLDQLRLAFGEDVGFSFAWHVTYLVCLSSMALTSGIFTAVTWSDADAYRALMPVVSFLIVSWTIAVTETQSAVVQKLECHWHKLHQATLTRADDTASTVSSELSFAFGRQSSSKKWKQQRSACLSWLKRNFKFQLLCAPILILEWLFIWSFFLGFFWLQLWTTFEWGGCREYNRHSGTLDCMSPEFLYPVWGKVFGAVPSFAQGLGFEMVSGLSKMSVDILVSMQTWPSQDEMRCAAATYYFFLEVVAKLGFICLLGFLYVPDYGADASTCTHRIDYWFLGDWSFSCLKVNVPPFLRLQLFISSVKGPFLISALLGIFKTTLLPILIEKLRAFEDRAQPLRCLVRLSIFLLRLMMVVLYCDWNARGVGGAGALCETPLCLQKEPWAAALREAQRRVFEPFEEYVELLLHFLWVSCFLVVYPLGGVLALGFQALELRCDTLKLLAARRQPFPRHARLAQVWVPVCAKQIVHISIVMNVLVLLLPYALAAQGCDGDLSFNGGCMGPTAALAIAGVAVLELYWYGIHFVLTRCQSEPKLDCIEESPCADIVPVQKVELKLPKAKPKSCCDWMWL
ncbi:unnamed protein product [Effrenium voratum]|uniref:Anoctamin transmembrane domain-containing protein n=1 Tax=Effrenium voratum TaxID=2562239 RepID=A0AA36N7J4_9DINO|nr:unnamed protein product [Effrenium voratum]